MPINTHTTTTPILRTVSTELAQGRVQRFFVSSFHNYAKKFYNSMDSITDGQSVSASK